MEKRLFLLIVLFLGASLASAQLFKDTIWVPVTFYDFHSDKSNPEFEITTTDNGTVHQNMVAQLLDSEGKPVLGPAPYANMYIKYWYRPWNESGSVIHARGDSTVPIYNNNLAFTQISHVNNDTAYKNIVIHDSLPFLYIGNGLYRYNNQSFFPLDNRGFGNEGKFHNYSFTMELKWRFQKKTGQTFDFSSDDDLWAFVNGKLAMDLGGIHTVANGSFSMNAFSQIPENSLCTLSVFYAERRENASGIKVTTDMAIVSSPVPTMRIEPDSAICPGDTILVKIVPSNDIGGGVSLPLTGYTYTFGLIDPLNPSSTFTKINSTTCRFVPVKPGTAKIWVDFYDSINKIHFRDTATVIINQCISGPHSIGFYGAPGDPKTMSPLPDTIMAIRDTTINIYVKLFDANGVCFEDTSISNHIMWTVSDSNASIRTFGSMVTFKSNVAFKNYILTANLIFGSQVLRRSFVIRIIPGTLEEFLFIEPNPDGLTASPNDPQLFPDTTITLNSNETIKKAYAVFRDRYGNFIRFSSSTEWSIDKPIASVTVGNAGLGEVIITRTDSSGLTKLHATDKKTNIQASANLKIVNYFYKELEVTVKQKVADKDTLLPVDSLIMHTNQDTVFYVIGLRSDNNQWEPTSGNWEISNSLTGKIKPSSGIASFMVSPVDTATGWVRVTQGNDNFTKPDTVIVIIRGCPGVRAIDAGNKFEPSHFSCKLTGSKLTLSSPQKYIGSLVMISDISGRTIEKFVIENTKMNRILGSKNAGAGSGLYIITVKGRSGRIVVPISNP